MTELRTTWIHFVNILSIEPNFKANPYAIHRPRKFSVRIQSPLPLSLSLSAPTLYVSRAWTINHRAIAVVQVRDAGLSRLEIERLTGYVRSCPGSVASRPVVRPEQEKEQK